MDQPSAMMWCMHSRNTCVCSARRTMQLRSRGPSARLKDFAARCQPQVFGFRLS